MKVVLDHVGIAVGDLPQSLAFFQDVLGLEMDHSETVAAQQVHATFLQAGGPTVELLAATSAESVVAKFVARRGPGLHHVAFRVSDIEAALTELKARGVRLIDEHPRPGAEGALVAFVHPASAGGVLVELKQARGGRPTRIDRGGA